MAYEEGYKAYKYGFDREDCPYKYGEYGYEDWQRGYSDAAMDD